MAAASSASSRSLWKWPQWAATHHRMVVDPADVLPEAPGAVLPAVQEHGVETAQAEEMGRGNIKSPPGNQDGDAHDHEEPGGQAPGFLPDYGIRQGPRQPHPEPEVGAGLPEKHQQPQGPAESRYQVTRVWQELSPPLLCRGGPVCPPQGRHTGSAPTLPAWPGSSGAGRSSG